MPVTRARPPTRQNGTSAPERRATAGSSHAGPAQHRGGVGRTAAEARRRPGCACRCARRRRRPTSGERPAHEVGVVVGHTGGAAPRRSRGRRRRLERERVGEVERDHLGVDQVVAVGAHAGDAQRERQLGRRSDDVHRGRRYRATAGQPAPVLDVELLGACRRARRPRGANVGGRRRRPASGAASCAADRSRRAPARTARRDRVDAGCGAPGDRDERGVDLRARQEHRRAGTCPTTSRRRPVRDLHRRGAVRRRRRRRGEPLADLALHHHQHAVDRRRRRRAGRARAAWRRCTEVGDERPAVVRRPGARASRASARRRRPPWRSRRRAIERPREHGQQVAVDLDRGDVGAGLGQRQRERAEPGADLDHAVTGPDPASRAMRRTVFGSTTKFWPSARLGRMRGGRAGRSPAAG